MSRLNITEIPVGIYDHRCDEVTSLRHGSDCALFPSLISQLRVELMHAISVKFSHDMIWLSYEHVNFVCTFTVQYMTRKIFYKFKK